MKLREIKSYGIAVLENNEVVFIFKDHDDTGHPEAAGVRYLHNQGRNFSKHKEQQVLTFGLLHGGIDFTVEVIQFWPMEANDALLYEDAIRKAIK